MSFPVLVILADNPSFNYWFSIVFYFGIFCVFFSSILDILRSS